MYLSEEIRKIIKKEIDHQIKYYCPYGSEELPLRIKEPGVITDIYKPKSIIFDCPYGHGKIEIVVPHPALDIEWLVEFPKPPKEKKPKTPAPPTPTPKSAIDIKSLLPLGLLGGFIYFVSRPKNK
jgi:hypothetical protein